MSCARTSSIRRLFLAVFLTISVGGCATVGNIRQLEAGPGIDFDAKEIAAHRDMQDKVLVELVTLSNLPGADSLTPDWDAVVNAGIDYADSRCEAYMHALFRLNRDKRTVTSELGLIGTAAAGVMAAVTSAAKDVAIVAIAFGLAGTTVDNLSSNLLYDLDPSSVRTLVKTMQREYKNVLGRGYPNRPAAMAAIRNYALLCVPANIEAEVNLAVKKATPESTAAVPSAGKAPTVTNAVTVVSDTRFKADVSSALLRTFLFPNGSIDNTRRARLESYLRARGFVDLSVVSFINGDFAEERVRALKFFNLAN